MREKTARGLAALGVSLLLPASVFASGLPLRGLAAERFLSEARVISMKPIGVGITKPMKVTLTDGEITAHAVWKTIDELRNEVYRDAGGGFEPNFRDSYRYEVAAYELDKLLDLGLVPPTVERTIDGKTGSLQLWVEGAFTELERREEGLRPEADDYTRWTEQIYRLRLLNQLVFNSDQKNVRNVLYDREFRVYAIDNSRSFRRLSYLANEQLLIRFSRSLLGRLERLEHARLVEALGVWLSESEIETLLVRRDLLLEAAERRAERYGAEAVYYR